MQNKYFSLITLLCFNFYVYCRTFTCRGVTSHKSICTFIQVKDLNTVSTTAVVQPLRVICDKIIQKFQRSLHTTPYHHSQISNSKQHWCNCESNRRNLTQFWPISFIQLTDVALVSQNLITAPSSLREERLLQPPSILGKETTLN